MTDRTVLVTDHDFDELDIERSVLGSSVSVVDATAEGVADAPVPLSAVDGILNLRATIDRETIEQLTSCRIIARYGIGVDNIDTDAAHEHGIVVTNVPDYCLEEVATHTIAMILASARSLFPYARSVAEGGWDRGVGEPIHRLSSATVGVVGYGAIGRQVGALAAAFGATVLASDPVLSADDLRDEPATLTEFEPLLERSDYVTVHAPLTEGTRGLIDASALDSMKPSAVLINVARGPIVDDAALVGALDEDEIAGAAIDVYPDEPPDPAHPLRTHPDVISTPHVAWYSEEADVERRRTAAEQIRAAFAGTTPEHAISREETPT